jgi:hypothetical protein
MGWVNSLHSSPNASQSTVVDPYLFAQPFAHAQLTHANIDTLLNEAQAMAKDLKAQDDKIAAAVATFRAAARAASASGKPLPSIPPQLNTLELQRTALLVQHMVSLQTSLGATAAATLDRYLYREFAPHVSLKAFANPPSSPSQSGVGAFYGGVP